MDFRLLTAASVLAAMGMLAGCGTDDRGEPDATGDAAYRENTANPAPAPESSLPGTQEPTTSGRPTTGQDVAGRDDRMTEPGTQPGQMTDRPAGQATTSGEELGMTEFAAMDTNSDGVIGEDEWQPEAADGMEFEEIDQDGSGDIDREEFRQAVGGETTWPDEDALDPTTP